MKRLMNAVLTPLNSIIREVIYAVENAMER